MGDTIKLLNSQLSDQFISPFNDVDAFSPLNLEQNSKISNRHDILNSLLKMTEHG